MRITEALLFILILIAGLLFGSILGEMLAPVIPLLKEYKRITWSPSANLEVLKYNLHFEVKLNLASIAGLALAFWLYRKIR